jgi:hypothetical protein
VNNLTDALDELADRLELFGALRGQPDGLSDDEVLQRLEWLDAEVAAGRDHPNMVAFLGPETLVSVRDGELFIRIHEGMDLQRDL